MWTRTSSPTHGIGLDEVANAITNANVNLPTGTMYGDARNFVVKANGQLLEAMAYGPVIVAYRNGNPVRLNEVAHVYDGVENDKVAGWFRGERAITLAINKQPGTNVVAGRGRHQGPAARARRPVAGRDEARSAGGPVRADSRVGP